MHNAGVEKSDAILRPQIIALMCRIKVLRLQYTTVVQQDSDSATRKASGVMVIMLSREPSTADAELWQRW
ncbi:MAG: hypothetical protein NVS9B2_30690 [Steroidobacteraceae bacterium]